MKNKIILLLIFGLAGGLATTASFAQSAGEMNTDAGKQYRTADKKLNDTYQALLKSRKNDPIFIEKLKNAQKAWIAYRDAMVALQFLDDSEDRSGISVYGDNHSMCLSMVQEDFTKAQTKLLSEWLPNHTDEGDVCSGSKRDDGDNQ